MTLGALGIGLIFYETLIVLVGEVGFHHHKNGVLEPFLLTVALCNVLQVEHL